MSKPTSQHHQNSARPTKQANTIGLTNCPGCGDPIQYTAAAPRDSDDRPWHAICLENRRITSLDHHNHLEQFSQERYDKLLAETIETIQRLGHLKGGEYSGDNDRLANFRRHAIENEVPMELIWKIYAGKHWDAISQYCKDRLHNKTRQRLEPIAGRLDDLIVYAILLKAIVLETEEGHQK